jgi:CRP-like cAMP-binding protein
MSVLANHQLADYIRSKKTIREYRRGEIICYQGEVTGQVFLLDSGIVKIYDIDEGGDDRTISLFRNGSTFPISWLLVNNNEGNFYYYEALTNVRCYVADIASVYKFVRTRPHILLALTDQLVRSYINLEGRIQNLEKSHVGERLEFLLFYLATVLGDSIEGVTEIAASITQEDIAKLAGVTRESLSLEINHRGTRPYWREKGNTYIDLGNIDSTEMPTILGSETL